MCVKLSSQMRSQNCRKEWCQSHLKQSWYSRSYHPAEPPVGGNQVLVARSRLKRALAFQLVLLSSTTYIFFLFFSFFERHNGPASAAPCQEGHFWKRSETKKRILRVAQKTQIRAALQELLESLPCFDAIRSKKSLRCKKYRRWY